MINLISSPYLSVTRFGVLVLGITLPTVCLLQPDWRVKFVDRVLDDLMDFL